MKALLASVFTLLIAESFQYHTYEYNINNGRGGSQYVSYTSGLGRAKSLYLSRNRLTLPKFNSNANSFVTFSRSRAQLNRGLTDGDFVAQIREQTNTLKESLGQISADPRAADILNKIIDDDDNICFSSLDDGIKSIEIAASLLENAEGDIKTLLAKINTFRTLSDPVETIREAGSILRTLGPFIKNITPKTSVCQESPEQAFGSLTSFAALMEELAANPPFSVRLFVRQNLQESSKILVTVTKFLNQVQNEFSKFQKLCNAEREYNIDAINAIGDLMVSLGDLFKSLGGADEDLDFSKGKDFVDKLVRELNKLEDIGLGDLKCDKPGEFKVAAQTMDELAILIEEVGLDKIQQQFGIDFSFIINQ